MFGLVLARKIAVLLAIAVVAALAAAASGCVSEEEANSTVGPAEEHVADPQCLEQIGTEFPAQHPTAVPPERAAELTPILCSTEAVGAILSGRELGHDLWIRVSHVYEHRGIRNYGETPIAMVNFYFDPPLSFGGEVPVITKDPCQGHGIEGYLEPNDPCVDEPEEYGKAYREFTTVEGVVAEVDFREGQVVEVFAVPVSSDEMQDIRGYYQQ